MTLAQQYAHALYEAADDSTVVSDATRLVGSLVALLERKGHTQLLPKIAEEYRHAVGEKSVHGHTTVTVARVKDLSVFKEKINAELFRLGASGKYSVSYDQTLVGGFCIEYRGRAVDAGYKTQLLSLYRKMIVA